MSDWALAAKLARRDLRARFRGLRLLLVCLFLGVGALAAIGSLASSITGELAARGQILLGGDVEFEIGQRRADADERQAIAALGRLSETVRMQSMAISEAATRCPSRCATNISQCCGIVAAMASKKSAVR